MKMRSALIAHPFPIVVDGLAALAVAAGFTVTRAGDAAAMRTALAAAPDLAVIAANFGGDGAAPRGATRMLVIADAAALAAAANPDAANPDAANPDAANPDAAGRDDDAIALTAPVARLVAAIAAAASALTASATAGATAGATATAGAAPALTPRERDVARLVAAGQRNRLIAATLGISEGTVKMHLHNVYAKLGLESRTQLAMSAGALGAG